MMAKKLQRLQQFLRWFWQITRLYFFSSHRWRALGLLILVISGTIVSRPLGLQASIYTSKITTALSEKDFAVYQQTLLISTGLTALVVFTFLAQSFIDQKFTLYWREWLTDHFLNRYFGNRVFNVSMATQKSTIPTSEFPRILIILSIKPWAIFLGLGGTILTGFLYIGTL